ncbi:MAG TPA: DUF6049 family protein [Kofleriaceae bacterium]
MALTTLVPFLVVSCGGRSPTVTTAPVTAVPVATSAAPPLIAMSPDALDGLDLVLSPGRVGAPPVDHSTLAPATKLPDAEAAALLAHAPAITTDPADVAAFALRPKSLPPPRAGGTVGVPFPPPPSSFAPPAIHGAALSVVRYLPQGKVALAPELSVTFNQPMVPVTGQDDAATTLPVQLSPQPKGQWRWIGTRTILFDPAIRFPQATTYRVTIPAGTKSIGGGALAKATAFSFETPAATLVTHWPGGGTQPLDVPMFLRFDQRVDAAAVMAKLRLTGAGKTFALRALTTAELAADPIRGLVADATADASADRIVAVRATEPLPPDTAMTLVIPAGTPSAEGPNPTPKDQSFEFRTYPPLKVVRSQCAWGDYRCPPGSAFDIQFNNALDEDAFAPAQVIVTPTIDDMQITAQGSAIIVAGSTQARTTYTVTISGQLRDRFGQRLGADQTFTFDVKNAQPTFYGPEGVVVLDPAVKKPSFDLFSTNYAKLKVKLYAVQPSDFAAWNHAIENGWNHDHPPVLPGKLVETSTVATGGGPNQLVETHVDLAPALHAGHGQAVAIVEPSPWSEKYEPPRAIAWVQATGIAVDAHVDQDSLVAFATELATGKALGGVELTLMTSAGTRLGSATTAANGTATIPLPDTMAKGAHAMLVAKHGDDTAFVAEEQGEWSTSSWVKVPQPKELRWFVFDDRALYKPGETVSLKGWLRLLDPGRGGDLGGLGREVDSVSYRVIDSENNELAKGSAPVSAAGGFDAHFTLPKTPNLGEASVQLKAVGHAHGDFTHGFQIEEFRRPEFEVSTAASQGPIVVGGSADVTATAKYYAGGALPDAAVSWSVTATPTTFTPPNREAFAFGDQASWWGNVWDEAGVTKRGPSNWQLAAKTDAAGEQVLHLDVRGVKPAVPMSVTASAAVTDVNRQQWSSSSALLVHPATRYVGLRAHEAFVDPGHPYDLDVIATDLDGKATVGAKLDVRAERIKYEYKKGRYQTTYVDAQACALVAAADPVPCSFATPKGGAYRVTATVTDERGRLNMTRIMFYVSGGDEPPAREVAQEAAHLVADKKLYADGETAKILVQAPFYPAEGVVTWRRSGIVKLERISLAGPTTTLTVPIADAMVPGMTVHVDLVGTAPRVDATGRVDDKLPRRPAYAVGDLYLPVPPAKRTLAVAVEPAAAKLSPGEKTSLAVRVTDAAGKPVADSEVAVVVVDEAILALAGTHYASPLDAFYGARSGWVRDYYERSYVRLARPSLDDLVATRAEGNASSIVMTAAPAAPSSTTGSAPGGRGRAFHAVEKGDTLKDREADKNGEEDFDGVPDEADAQPTPNITVRTNMNPLAVFAPAVHTDAAGRATVALTLPDNLTRYRIVAIAAAGDRQFGKGESALTARLPLMVRLSPPRFLNFGDTFRLPVTVQNQTDAPMRVKLAARATNAALTDGASRVVTVPPNDRVEVQFPAAAERAGTARFQVVGVSGAMSDAQELSLPVWTPATTEAFATYGVIDGKGEPALAQRVQLPGKVVTQFGGLEVSAASTNLQSLTDALLYLVHYPYECAEQRSSRVLAIAALRDVLTAFHAKDLPSAAAMEASMRADTEHLSQMQNDDGGFAFWDRGHPSEPYLSVYVTSALLHAKAKGYAIDATMLARALGYLRVIETHYPHYYSPEVRRAISSYALSVRAFGGDVDVAKAKKLMADGGGADKLGIETVGWLLATLAKNPAAKAERVALMRAALNKVTETAGAANFVAGYGDGAYLLLASDRRVDSVVLDAFIAEDPASDLIPKLVTGLLAHRTAGRWMNTQENSFALVALDRYFQTYEKATPDFVARVWLGADYAGDHEFKGHTTETAQIDVPMADVATHDKQDLVIQKAGVGRLYYRIGMTYAPASLQLAPADRGFVVQRRYEAIDDPKDVSRSADGVWHVKAGARVRVRVTMVNENRRYQVALVDPLPAGLEPMNAALATTGPIPLDPKEQASRDPYWWWYGPWYEHQNLRDERVEAFAALVWEGVHEYAYVARATTPGTFVVPPAHAEEMYMPETFGRSGTDRLVVE